MNGNMKITFQRPDGSVETRAGRKLGAMVKAAFGPHAWLCAPEIGESAIGHVIDWTTGGIIAEVVGCSGPTAAKISSTCMTRTTCLMLAGMERRNKDGEEADE
jgi:hypothetical protein